MSEKRETPCRVDMSFRVPDCVYCPICDHLMHEYFMGDDVRRYRCMACETKVEVVT